jgi:hypothetical protein
MPIDLFGYNGVFEFDQNVVSKLLATYLYERYLVALGGQVLDGDFISAKVPIKDGEIHLYLELARPFLHIQTADGTNLVTLHVPFSQVGVFLLQNGLLTRYQLPFLPGQLLALVLFDVPIQKTDSGLSIDLSGLTGENVGIQIIGIKPGPTGVGAAMITESSAAFLDDAMIENMLKDKDGNKVVSAKDLRNQLADFLKTGVIGPTSVPISPGGTESALRSWDLLLFGNANDRDSTDQPGDAGADLLLFQDGNTGRGVRTDAGQTLPPALETPPYTWTVSLRASVLLEDIGRALDDGQHYYVQGDVVNTQDTPLGYLVVPPTGSHGYALPTGAGKITVAAPQNGQAQVTIAGGGLTPHSRARLRNLDRSIESGFTADGSGGAPLSIGADPGERLALAIDAISLPSDSSTVVWRPQITFGDGEITASFHYYHYIEHWCDAEGDASVRVALYADRTKPFSIGVRVIDANASAPWWAYVVAWLGPGLIGQDVFAPILVGLVPTIMHALAQSFIGGNIGTLGSALTDHISAPSPENVKMVLDQVDVYPAGVQLSGRADSGEILAYDRSVAFSTQPGVVLSTTKPEPVYMSFGWKPDIGTISITSADRCAVITNNAREAFWAAGYDDIPTDDAFTRDPFSLSAGDTVMVWVEIDGGQAKVLFEWPLLNLLPISITWIVLRQRVGRSVKLVNSLVATAVGGYEGLAWEVQFLRYDGTISLSAQKFFLSEDTQAVGDEQWFWDEQIVTDVGLIFPGGSITLDAAQRRLIVHLDQSGLPDQQNIPVTHWVRFHGTDVFGLTLEAKIQVWTLPKLLLPRPIALNPPLGPGFIDALGGDRPAFDRTQLVGALIDLLATRIGPIEAQSLARSVANALAMGAATLDGAGAAGVLALLGGGPGFGQH